MKIGDVRIVGYLKSLDRVAEARRLTTNPSDFRKVGEEFVKAALAADGKSLGGKTGVRTNDGKLAEPRVPLREALRLVSRVLSLVQTSSEAQLALNAATADKVRQGDVASKEQLAQRYESALANQEDALNALEKAMADAQATKDVISDLKSRLAELEAAMADATPGSDEHDSLLARHTTLTQDIAARESELKEKLGVAKNAEASSVACQKVVDELFKESIRLNVDLQQGVVEKDKGNLSRLLGLMSLLGEMLLESGEVRAKTQSDMVKVQEEARIAKMKQDADQYDRDLAKAEAMNKAMGCIGKILGAIVTAVAFVGAAFTGGASLAIAGIGVALMLADTVAKAVTGKSFMEEAFKPIMAILQPVLQFLMDKVSDLLKGFGVSEQTARMVSMIAVSVAIAAAVVAISVTGLGSAVGNVASKIASKIGSSISAGIQRTIGRLIPEAVKRATSQLGRDISNGASRLMEVVGKRLGLATDPVSTQVRGQQITRAAGWLQFANSTTTGALNVNVQSLRLSGAKSLASMNLAMKDMQILEEMMTKLTELLARSMESSTAVFLRISQLINQRTATGIAMARAMHGNRAV